MLKIFLVPLAILITSTLYAQEYDFFHPIGGMEGITGNTGIGRDGSIGSVFYNPAGLARFKTSKVSASGSAFSRNEIKLDGQGISEKMSNTLTTPAQITSAFHRERFNWAFSILVPKNMSFKYKIEREDSELGQVLTLNGESSTQETLFGPSIAYKLTPQFKIGLSLFGSLRDEKNNRMTFFDDGVDKYLSYYESNSSAISLFPLIGFLYTPSSHFSLGLRLSGPSVQVSGTEESRNSEILDGNQASDEDYVNDINYQRPVNLGFGAHYKFMNRSRVLFDVTTQFKNKYEIYNGEGSNDDELMMFYKVAHRFSSGFEFRTSQTDAICLGLSYTQAHEEDDLDYMGGTIGYRSIEKIADTSLGIYFNRGSSSEDGLKTSHFVYGLFISTSISFLEKI